MNTPSPIPPTRATRRPVNRRLLVGGLVIVLAGLWLGYWWTTPARLTRQAERQLAVDPTRAERLASQALDASGDQYVRAWLVRSRAFLKLQQPIEAAGCFGVIPHPETADQDALLDLAEDAHAAGEVLLADLSLGAALKGPASGPKLQRALLQIRGPLLSATEMERLIDELAKIPTRDADTWRVIAETRRSRGELAKAVGAYRVAVDLPSGRVSAAELQGRLAQLLIDLGEYEQARPLVTQSIDAGNPTADDYVRQAILYRVDGQEQQGLEILERVIADQPRHLTARLLRAAILWERGKRDEAVANLKSAVQDNPYHPEAHYRLALALQQLGQTELASEHFARQTLLARAQRELLNTRNLLHEQPDNRELMRRVATLYRELGQERAAEQWEQEADRLPQSGPIR